MKKFITKTISVSFLCILLAVLMLFSGCNSGSSASNFFQSIKEATNLQKYDFEMSIETEVAGSKNTVEIEGIHESADVMSVSITTSSEGSTLDLGELIFRDNRIYIDISGLANQSDYMADIFEGKDYVYIDFNDYLDTVENSGVVNESSMEIISGMDSFSGCLGILDIFLDHVYDILDKAAQGVDPAVLSKDGSKHTLTITDENIGDYLENILNVLADDEDWFATTLPAELEKIGLNDLAEYIRENQEFDADSIIDLIDEFPESLEDPDLELTAYSEFKSEGNRTWDFVVEFNDKLGSNDIAVNLECTITENDSASVVEIDEDDAESYFDVLNESLSSYSTSSGLLNVLGGNIMTPGYYSISEMSMEGMTFTAEDLEAMGIDPSTVYIKIEGAGIGEICIYGEIEELSYTDTQMTVDGDPANYTYSNGVITIEQDGAKMSFEYDADFAP